MSDRSQPIGQGHEARRQADRREARARRRPSRSRFVAVIVLVLVALIIALTGIADSLRADGSEGTPFRLLPLSTEVPASDVTPTSTTTSTTTEIPSDAASG